MGIFSFVKEAGEKLFKRGESDAENLDEARKANELLSYVMGMKLPVDNVKIEFENGTATVFGSAESQAIKENVIIGVGNIAGVAQVDDRMTVNVPAPQAKFYTVKSGDSLSKIAKEFYGDPMKYPDIFDANKPMLSDPDKIYPGQVLRIPGA